MNAVPLEEIKYEGPAVNLKDTKGNVYVLHKNDELQFDRKQDGKIVLFISKIPHTRFDFPTEQAFRSLINLR